MNSSPPTWAIRVLWLCLPFTLGDIFSAGLDGRGSTFSITWQVALWLTWALTLAATLVQLPITLTFVRSCVPLALVLGIGFSLLEDVIVQISVAGAVGLLVAIALTLLVMSGNLGDDFINGASYGDERRLALRPPGYLIVGPIQLVWTLTVAPVIGAVALAATAHWAAAGALGLVSIALAWYGFRLLNRLSTRCLVLVPAGMTLVDPLTLAEPTLFRRDGIVRLGPAPVDCEALDLSAGAPGLILSAEFNQALSVVPAARRGKVAEPQSVTAVLIALSRPGMLLELAERRRIAVGRR